VQITLVSTCSLQSLSGTYTYVLTGFKFHSDRFGEHPFSEVGQLVGNGNGNFTGIDTVSDAGMITTARQYTGTYTNCTGSATSSVFGDMNLVITNNYQNVDIIQTERGANVVGTAQQQFH
jgi:hypothetical protein